MPTPASIAARIAREGEPVQLRRANGPSITLPAFIRGYRADELQGAIQQGDREARISDLPLAVASWPGPPKAGDQLVLRPGTPQQAGVRIQSVETRQLRGAVAVHVLQLRG